MVETAIGEPLTRAAEILGERWNILLLRELSLGPRRFGDLRRALDGMSPSVLAGRLVRLEQKRIVRRRELPPPSAFPVYELDDAGVALAPVLAELARWGLRFHPPSASPERPGPAASGSHKTTTDAARRSTKAGSDRRSIRNPLQGERS
jgi:DNA-binding HxlR family transcriptional regulator